jgi:hypothetical protein
MSISRNPRTWLKITVVIVLVLTLLPVQAAFAGSKTNAEYGVTLRWPDSSTHCTKLAKFFSKNAPADWTVTYQFYTASNSGLGELIDSATVSGSEFVVFPYPGGPGNGMYAVMAQYKDASGAPVFKLAGKWTMACVKPGQTTGK